MEYLNGYVKNNNLKLNIDQVDKKYSCTLCTNILLDPIVLECNCSFCSRCIKSHLINVNHNCPKCSQEVNIESDIHPDIHMRHEILELTLECPNTICHKQIQIKFMKDHIENCANKGYKCPLELLGCNEISHQQTKVKDHIADNLDGHLSLMTKSINENIIMIQSINNNNLENSKKIEDMGNMMENVQLNADQIKEITEKTNLLGETVQTNTEIIKNVEKENRELRKYISKYENRTNLIIKNLEENIKSLMNEVDSLNKIPSKTIQKEYLITFKDIVNRKLSDWIESEIFTLNNYSFTVRMRVDSWCNMYFEVVSQPNKKSDEIKWPIPFQIEIRVLFKNGLTDQNKIFGHKNSNNKHEYNKPPPNGLVLKDSGILKPHVLLPKEVFVNLKALF